MLSLLLFTQDIVCEIKPVVFVNIMIMKSQIYSWIINIYYLGYHHSSHHSLKDQMLRLYRRWWWKEKLSYLSERHSAITELYIFHLCYVR